MVSTEFINDLSSAIKLVDTANFEEELFLLKIMCQVGKSIDDGIDS